MLSSSKRNIRGKPDQSSVNNLFLDSVRPEMEAEVPLLKESPKEIGLGFTRWRTIAAELKQINLISLPMMVVTVSQYLLRMSPMFMLGHLDDVSLSSASIAISLSHVTGFSFLLGVSSALETLCGQAYGAKQYRRVGTYIYTAILCLFILCIPVSLLWIYAGKLLLFIGQDPIISAKAGNFMIWLIPTLFPFAILHALVRYLQTQSLILPMLLAALASLCLQLSVCWAFIFKFNLGNAGAALSIAISHWFYVILLVLYVKFSPSCEKTRPSFSRDVFVNMREFFQLAIPSAGMICLEWWSFELVILLSGLLPNPQLETSVLSICLTILSLHFFLPYSLGISVSTRVSNELGAGKPEVARTAIIAVLLLAVAEMLISCGAIYGCRRLLGYVYSHNKKVVNYVKEMVPFLCLSMIMDSFQCVLSGVARGSAWQHIGAYVNLGSYYLVGIPVSLLLGFVLNLKGKGLWCGLVVGATLQSLSLFIITGLADWEKQARDAKLRILSGKFAADSVPI